MSKTNKKEYENKMRNEYEKTFAEAEFSGDC